MQIDIRVLELLSSKLCHDLVSPISAINNGVELIEDIGGSVVDEAMKLIGDSAGHASRRLRLFRLAYGRAGSEENLGVKDVRQIAEQYMAGGKITLNWPAEQPGDALAGKRGFLKLLLNLVIMAEETLPYGGTISLVNGSPEGCKIEITGRNAQLTAPIAAAFEGTAPIEDLTPRSVQSYITGRFGAHFGLTLKHHHPSTDHLELLVLATAG